MNIDVAVVGGGAAGLTAAMYTARAGLKTVVFAAMYGGQTVNAAKIENYPGIFETDGFTLMETIRRQAEESGAEIKSETVTNIDFDEMTVNGTKCRAIILAMGTEHRKLGLDGEEVLTGRGISYCAACDGNFFRGKTVVVAGGGNTAVFDAIYLSKLCKKVFIVHRRDAFRAEPAAVEKLKNTENVEFVLNSNITEFLEKDGRLSGVRTETREIECDGLFVAIGSMPADGLVKGKLKTDGGGIEVNTHMETSRKGVFAAGDVTNTNQRQIITAAGDGAKAAKSAIEYLQKI